MTTQMTNKEKFLRKERLIVQMDNEDTWNEFPKLNTYLQRRYNQPGRLETESSRKHTINMIRDNSPNILESIQTCRLFEDGYSDDTVVTLRNILRLSQYDSKWMNQEYSGLYQLSELIRNNGTDWFNCVSKE